MFNDSYFVFWSFTFATLGNQVSLLVTLEDISGAIWAATNYDQILGDLNLVSTIVRILHKNFFKHSCLGFLLLLLVKLVLIKYELNENIFIICSQNNVAIIGLIFKIINHIHANSFFFLVVKRIDRCNIGKCFVPLVNLNNFLSIIFDKNRKKIFCYNSV